MLNGRLSPDGHVSQYVDAKNATFNQVGRDQYNTFNLTTNEGKENLSTLHPANMDASSMTECLPGTRLDIISFVNEWASSRDQVRNVLWLHGLAGSGKSALAATIANSFRQRGRLGAFVFFNRDIADKSDPAMVVRTIAYQLASCDPRIAGAISAAVTSMPSIAQSPLHLQFSKLLIEPLSSVTALHAEQPLVVVLDALDECGNAKTRRALLEVLSAESVHLRMVLRIFITSRAEIDIKNKLDSQSHVLARELDITTVANHSDIITYIRRRLAMVRQDNTYLSLPHDWPGDVKVDDLATRASGLFVWAFIACNFIEDGHHPEERLGILLRAEVAAEAEASLDVLYRTALECSGKWSDPLFGAEFRTILGTVLAARNPLSCTAIDTLVMPTGRPSLHTVSHFGCVLRWKDNEPVRILHPSFADFLSNRARCKNDAWFIDIAPFNQDFTKRCLRRLNQVLHQNICGLTLSEDEVNASLSEDISYACTFWIEHICTTSHGDVELQKDLKDFILWHLLHWFEAMSILKLFEKTVGLLDRLQHWIEVGLNLSAPSTKFRKIWSKSVSPVPNLADFVGDAHRFSQAFRDICEQHPLLIYTAALPFTPTRSALYDQFNGREIVPRVVGGWERWSPVLLVISGHSGAVMSVAFSPNGDRIVSGSGDKTVRVYDSLSGADVLSPLEGHDEGILSVAFSPDGKRIASGSQDKTIRIWDSSSGAPLLDPLRGHGGWVRFVVFSPDGRRLASCSTDETIRVWDVTSAVETLPLLIKTEQNIGSLRFSPDGSRIICYGREWDTNSGQLIYSRETRSVVNDTLQEAHRRLTRLFYQTLISPQSTDVSSDGTRGVSGSKDGIVRIWDLKRENNEFSRRLHGSMSLIMSPDGSLVSTFTGWVLRLWSTTSGTELPFSETPGGAVRLTAFSPSGNRMVSISDNSTVRVWDTSLGTQLLHSLTDDWIKAVTFSPDGKHIICGMNDGHIRVMSAVSGKLICEPLAGHEGPVLSVACSSTGSKIISGSIDQSVRVWDAHSGSALLPPLRGHRSCIRSVAVSLDGRWIVSASEDGLIRRWDAGSGRRTAVEILAPVTMVNTTEIHVAFSSEGDRVICRLANELIYLFDSRSGDLLGFHFLVGVSVTYDPQYPIVMTRDGWIMDVIKQEPLSKLPAALMTTPLVATAACKSAITFATTKEVFTMHFTPGPSPQAPTRFQTIWSPPSFVYDPDALEEPPGSTSRPGSISGRGRDTDRGGISPPFPVYDERRKSVFARSLRKVSKTIGRLFRRRRRG